MSKISQEILDAIKQGKAVDVAMIPGHVNTPSMPANVLDVIVDKKNHEFKKVINAENFIEWIENVAANNQNEQANVEDKAIANSAFATECYFAKQSIEKNEKLIEGVRFSGFAWNYQTGTPKSVSLRDEMIDRAVAAFTQVMETMVTPIEARSKKLPTVIDPEELKNEEEIVFYMSRRD